MSVDDDRLISDQKKVVKMIRRYTNINLINTSGEPANEYDIEYKVRGYTTEPDGSIKIRNRHRVKIQLQFGYPHFPPTIKPLSSVFHPEIDDYVMPISNYWEENKSLADLVIHIGNMICGNVLNIEIPFNHKAAEYYKKHSSNLPLDTLKLVEEESKKSEREPLQFTFLAPLMKVLGVLIIISLISGGGLYSLERSRLNKAEKRYQNIQKLLAELEFRDAEKKANKILQSLDHFYILKPSRDNLVENIHLFLQSTPLRQGLLGNIKYGNTYEKIEYVHKTEHLKQLLKKVENYLNKSDLKLAQESMEDALLYAEKNNLASKESEVRSKLAQLNLNVLVLASDNAHENKDWGLAVAQHQKVISFINKEKRHLINAETQAAKTGYLLLLDKISYFSKKASEAEKRQDLDSALDHYNSLIDLIGKSQSNYNKALQSTLVESMQKAASVSEKLEIEKQRQWLLNNFKEIFLSHYPTISATALRSPQALFVKYDEADLIFDLSCLDKSSSTVVKLRLIYKYSPETEMWSVYDKEIE